MNVCEEKKPSTDRKTLSSKEFFDENGAENLFTAGFLLVFAFSLCG